MALSNLLLVFSIFAHATDAINVDGPLVLLTNPKS